MCWQQTAHANTVFRGITSSPREAAAELGRSAANLMAHYLAIVAYRCLVAGAPTGSLDFQVRWFQAEDKATLRGLIESEPAQHYNNGDGEGVSWELAHILAVEEFSPNQSSEEVIGFIASIQELQSLAKPSAAPAV